MSGYDRRATALHEAGHVAAEVMAGRVPTSATADWPAEQTFGFTHLKSNVDGVNPDWARDVIVTILCGPLSEAKPGWPPEWPLDEDPESNDARQLSLLASYLKLDRLSWYSLVDRAQRIARSPDFKRIVKQIASALTRVDDLDAGEIRFLIGPDLLRKYIPEKEQPNAA